MVWCSVSTDLDRRNVGAYVLGILDPDEALAFEEHLVGCDGCAAEVEALLPTALLLGDVSPNQAIVLHMIQENTDAPVSRPADLVRRAVAGTSALHRKQRPVPRHGQPEVTGPDRRLRVRAGIAAALVALAGFVAGTLFSGGEPSGDAAAAPAVVGASATAGPPTVEVAASEQFDVTDPRTGVHAVMVVIEGSWGSQISLTLGGVHGPLRCDLVAVSHSGQSTVVASWSVHAPGYGIPAEPELLTVHATTAIPLSDTDDYAVRAVAADGTRSTLVTMPV